MDVLFAGDSFEYVLSRILESPQKLRHFGKTIFLFPLDADTSELQVYNILPSFGCIKFQNHGEKRRNGPFSKKNSLSKLPQRN